LQGALAAFNCRKSPASHPRRLRIRTPFALRRFLYIAATPSCAVRLALQAHPLTGKAAIGLNPKMPWRWVWRTMPGEREER
jgi:hypothetical protein